MVKIVKEKKEVRVGIKDRGGGMGKGKGGVEESVVRGDKSFICE